MIDPASLIPAAPALPAPAALFEFLRLATFPLHLVAMNLVLGGSLLLAAAHLGLARGLPGEAAGGLSHALPTLMALTVNLGVPPLLFMQLIYGHLFYASSILMAWFWLSVMIILIAAYYGLYLSDAARSRGKSSPVILVCAALLLANAGLYVASLSLTQDPGAWTKTAAAVDGTFMALADPAYLPRLIHIATGAVCITGLVLALAGRLAWFMPASPGTEAFGLKLFAGGNLAGMASGLWYLGALPGRVLTAFMGRDPAATAMLALGFAAALAALLAAVKKKTMACVWLTVVSLAAMLFARESVRLIMLAPYFKPGELRVEPQLGPVWLFAAFAAAGIAVMAWLIRAFRRAGKEA